MPTDDGGGAAVTVANARSRSPLVSSGHQPVPFVSGGAMSFVHQHSGQAMIRRTQTE